MTKKELLLELAELELTIEIKNNTIAFKDALIFKMEIEKVDLQYELSHIELSKTKVIMEKARKKYHKLLEEKYKNEK